MLKPKCLQLTIRYNFATQSTILTALGLPENCLFTSMKTILNLSHLDTREMTFKSSLYNSKDFSYFL